MNSERRGFSSKYLLSMLYGGMSWGGFYECLNGKVVVCTNQDVLVYMPEAKEYEVTGYTHVDTLRVTDEDYAVINQFLNRERLLNLDPEPDYRVCDGYSLGITLYDENDEPYPVCGGYMPRNDEFNNIHATIRSCLPMEQLYAIRKKWVKDLEETNEGKLT